MKNIGINIRITDSDYSVWSNGLRQNIFILAKTLMALGDYNVYIVHTGERHFLTDKPLSWDTKRFKTVHFDDIKDDLDVYFIMGAEIYAEQGYYLKKRGCRLVYYNCGNRYIIEMEEILFKGGKGKRQDEGYLDEIWMIPQMMHTNHYYLQTLERVPVREIPFVWGSEFIDASAESLPNRGRYVPRSGAKRVSCFEPNLNVFKYCMYDIIITEMAYRQKPHMISHFYVTNAMELKNKERFISIMNKLDLVRNGIATFEARFQMPFFLSKYTDVVIATQWENALNYAYLDALYLKYPLVHNAHIVKDCGYYYEGFNAQQGCEQLLHAIENHDNNIDEYEARSAKTLARYQYDNPDTLREYSRLLKDLIEKGSTF